MHQIGSTNYARWALIFAAALASTTQAGASGKGAADVAAPATQENVSKMMAHMEATNMLAMNSEGLMLQMDLLHARCCFQHCAMNHQKRIPKSVYAGGSILIPLR